MKIRRGEQKSVRVKGVRKAGGQKRLDVGAESNKVALFFSKRAAHNTLPKGERVHFPTSEHNFPSYARTLRMRIGEENVSPFHTKKFFSAARLWADANSQHLCVSPLQF